MDFFGQNLKYLRDTDPELAERVARLPFSDNVNVTKSKSGLPVPKIAGITLHSQYHPLEEGEKAAREFIFDCERKTIVYGLGFGYHIQALLQKCSGEITVVEPLTSLFRAFMTSVDIRPFLPRVRFKVGQNPARLLAGLEPDCWNIFKHTPSLRIGEAYYNRMDEGLEVRNLLQTRALRVLVVNPIYGGSLPTAHHCSGALRNLGHEVATVDCEEFAQGFSSLKKVTRLTENSEALSRNFMNFMGDIAAAKAAEFQPDLILALAQAPLTPETIQKLKTLKVPIVFWFVEDFRTLPYWSEVAASYDHIFTLQDGVFHDELRSKGARDCYYLPQACFPDVHKPINIFGDEMRDYAADVSFMGAAYHNRIQSFPRLMDLDFKIWGTNWNLETPLGRMVQNKNKRVSTDDSVKIYGGAKINLNLHSSTYHYGVNPDGDFINPRTFEIAACQGFQLVDNRKDLPRMFNVGEEIIAFETIDQMRDQINYYLLRPDERRTIAEKSFQRVLKDHTMEHRMQELLVHVFLEHKSALASIGDFQRDPLDYCIEQAGEDTELGHYLEQFRGHYPFSLKTVKDHVHKGEGALDDKEILFLMLDQILKEKA